MTEPTIMTRHPDKTRQGVNISRAKYEQVRAAILDALRQRGELTFGELAEAVQEALTGRFEGSIMWYVTTVKLDLEARRELTRVARSRPQRIRLARP